MIGTLLVLTSEVISSLSPELRAVYPTPGKDFRISRFGINILHLAEVYLPARIE
jgi:hypothetical protein